MRKPHTDLTLSSDYYDIAGELLGISSDIFEKECDRQAELNPLSGILLDRSMSVVTLEDGTSDDGVCTVDIGTGQSALLLLCVGKGDRDPAVQARFSFSRWWSQPTVNSMCFLFPRNANPMNRYLSVVIPRAVLLFSSASRDPGCLSMEPSCSAGIGLYNHSQILSGLEPAQT